MSKNTIFVETHFLIWAVQGVCKPGQEAMLAKAKYALGLAKEKGTPLLVSTVSLAEFLGGIKPEVRPVYEQEVFKNFIVVAFDPMAARHAAEIQHEQMDTAKTDGYKNQRNVLKADMQILGCAKSNSPQFMYCEDVCFTALAKKSGINVVSMPEPPPEQLALGFDGHTA